MGCGEEYKIITIDDEKVTVWMTVKGDIPRSLLEHFEKTTEPERFKVMRVKDGKALPLLLMLKTAREHALEWIH